MQKSFKFYFDFSSPYAYLAATQINALASKQGYSVDWRPFLLGASFQITGRKPLVNTPVLRDYAFVDLQRTARELKVSFSFPEKFPILSVKPSRVFYHLHDLAEGQGDDQRAAQDFALAAFKAYFADNQDISSESVLAKLAEPFGLSDEAVHDIVNSQQAKQRFREAVDEAMGDKVFAAPLFDVDGEQFWGVDHLSQLERWLQTGGW